MSSYIGQSPGQGQIQYFTFTAAAGQTAFSGIDDNKYVLNYTPGFCDVFLNGRRLTPTSDYTATDGSTITLQSAASLNDVIFVASASTFDTADWVTNAVNYVYTATSGQTTFTGADDNLQTLSYVNGTILVSVNGINIPQSDYTATNGTSVVLDSGVNNGDIVQIFSLRTMAVVNFLPLTGGTMSGNITFGNSSVNTQIDTSGLTTSGNVNIRATGELVINPGAGIFANGGLGSAGQVLTSNASSVYWSTVSGGGGGGSGTVTSITAGTGLTGGTITTNGTIALANLTASGISGTGGISAITVDAYGRVTAVTGSAGYATSASPTFTGTVNMQAAIASVTLTDAANIDWNLNTGQVATVTLAGNRIINAPTNLRVGTFILHVIQDGVGGRTLTWNSVFKWPAGVAPALTTTAGRRDLFSFVCDGTNLYGSFLPDVR